MAILAECPVCHKKHSVKAKACPCGANLDNEKKNKKVRYHVVYRQNGKQVWRSLSTFKDCDPCSIEDARAVNSKFTVCKKEHRLDVFQIKPGVSMTFKEIADWYLSLDKVKGKKYYPTLCFNLDSFNKDFGTTLVSSIKPVDLEGYQVRRKNEGYSDSYIDQQIGAAKAVVNKAFDNRLIDGEPKRVFSGIKKLLKRSPTTHKLANARDRILTVDEYKRLSEYLPRHVKVAFALGFYGGMRRGEILNLTWDRVNLKDRVIELEAGDTKDSEVKTVPICNELYRLLVEEASPIRDAEADNHVVLYKGKPVKDIRGAIREACKKAKIPYGRNAKKGVTFHDTRHTFNTFRRKAGVDQTVIMSITGHSTDEMFRHYNTVDSEDNKQAMKEFESFVQGVRQR
jgi:integrase